MQDKLEQITNPIITSFLEDAKRVLSDDMYQLVAGYYNHTGPLSPKVHKQIDRAQTFIMDTIRGADKTELLLALKTLLAGLAVAIVRAENDPTVGGVLD